MENVAKDPIYEKIIRELKKDKTQYGRKIKLTAEMWYSFLTALQFGANIEQAYAASRMGEGAYNRYSAQSKTFRSEVEVTRQNVSLKSRLNIGQSILGKPERKIKVQNPRTKQIEEVTIPGVPGDTENSKWWLQNVDKIGKVDPEGPIALQPPKTQEEADFWARTLNKHSDYVASKSKSNKNS